MPFYLRKSISAGPFRFNLSNSGVGLSVGVKGLRIGTGPRGHYVQAGRGGLYYRASLGGKPKFSSRTKSTQPSLAEPNRPSRPTEHGRVTMVEVSSGDVQGMRDSSVADLIDDLNAKQARLPLGPMLGLGTAGLGLLMIFAGAASNSVASGVGAFALLAALPAWGIGAWLDQSLRRSVLFYNLDAEAVTKFHRVTTEFDVLAACNGKWHIQSGGAVRDLATWKQNAGAGHLVTRKSAKLAYSLPKLLHSNVTPPSLEMGRRTFYFFPEVTIVQDGKKFGSVGYGDLDIRWQQSRFIEEGRPPSDAQVVDQTWKHPNKSGGPDRKFKDNRRLPICLYDTMHLSSRSGVNELAEFSKVGVVERFATALRDLPRQPASELCSPLRRTYASYVITIRSWAKLLPPQRTDKCRVRHPTDPRDALHLLRQQLLADRLPGARRHRRRHLRRPHAPRDR